MPQGNPRPGEQYTHFKGRNYKIIAVATHSETREKMVVYEAMYADHGVYVRPYDMFISEVDHEKYPDVTQQYRFQINEDESGVDPLLLAFLDADTYEEKYSIVAANEHEMSDRLIDDMSASIDEVIEEGDFFNRLQQLKSCLRTKSHFEAGRLR